ncbi:hypothetical protein HPP92_014734 [Vanilla planifolia]|uniref:Glycosyl transferase CAP10 domain-containing protein n=1 Tax=Vanilla planifolia TaxID=51239 RepID=A0A835QQ47_VANPL|nr:hypothetical protein HPP92_014734 [Vanilla planifolia]
MVQRAKVDAAFRLVIVDGVPYIHRYHHVFQTRDVFTIWGILQLLRRHQGRVPDLDLMFNCEDMPVVRTPASGSIPPPPLFRYCKDDSTVDIVFPDWSFWGWPEVNIRPWQTMSRELREESERQPWQHREPYAYWKGNPDVATTRKDLMRCNVQGVRRGQVVVRERKVCDGVWLADALRRNQVSRLCESWAQTGPTLLAYTQERRMSCHQAGRGMGQCPS